MSKKATDAKDQVTRKSIKMLHSDPDNPRTISAEAMLGLKVSTKTFGDLSGIVFNDTTEELVAGHQRVKSLRRAGATDFVRTSDDEGYIEHPETKERFRIRFVKWDPAKQRAANLVANNPLIAGEYTEDAIDQLEALEQELVEFDLLALRGLEADLRKEFKVAKDEAEAEAGVDETGDLESTFTIVIECTSENQQRELLERFLKEGLPCRALT